MSTADVLKELVGERVEYELVPHAHTERASDEATEIGVPPSEVGKTLILKGKSGYIRAVIPASERLDLGKLRDLFRDHHIRLATEEELAADYADFALGAVPPIGGRSRDRIVVDPKVAELDHVVFEAGTHEESIRMRVADLIVLTEAGQADICQAEDRG
jgi:Ala-tRNA(Pro) deacylase